MYRSNRERSVSACVSCDRVLAGVLVAVLLAGCASRPATSTTSQGTAASPAPAPAGATASATAPPAASTISRASATATAPPGAPSAVATTDAPGSEQPVAIFHAFDQPYRDVTSVACGLADQGYSHIQIAPAQKSNPSGEWWARYQPVDYSVIDGKGSEQDLRALVAEADRCGLKIIADVVFNHMANMPEYADLAFPNLSPADFHQRCAIDYRDGNRTSEQQCWLGGLPDLDQTSSVVRQLQQAHLRTLLDLGIDGFRLDAAKHMPETTVKEVYIDFVNRASGGTTWNYLEVISDGDTAPEAYTGVAAVTDFVLYGALKDAFSAGGDLRSLRVPRAVADPRSVTFGQNHDTIRALNENAINPYADPSNSYLATAYVLAREGGTPLVLNRDHSAAAYIPTGVRFRRIMSRARERGPERDGEHPRGHR